MDEFSSREEELEYHQRIQHESYEAIEEWFEAYSEKREQHLKLYEFGMWLYYLIFKMRQTLKTEELGQYLLGILYTVEKGIETARENGHEMITAETWRDVEGGQQLLEALYKASREDELTVPDWMTEEE